MLNNNRLYQDRIVNTGTIGTSNDDKKIEKGAANTTSQTQNGIYYNDINRYEI